MEELRSWWEVPSIAHFCSLFRAAFDLSDFDIEDLEEGLLDSQKEGGCDFVTDLVCKLLNGCYGRDDICSFNYDLYVKDIIKYKWDGTDNVILQKSTFNELTLREKVEVVHSICEYRLDGEDVMELLKGFDGDSMRVEPLGKDREGGLYWYFYGSRLYKEDPEPKKELTREQKKKQERERRKEQQRKKKLEKEQRKQEKIQRRIARRVEKKKLLEMKKREKEEESLGKRRRSGRIQKIQEQQLMESSESSSEESSSEESETEESSSETEATEEEEESNSDTEVEEPPATETKPQKKEAKKDTQAKGKKTKEKPTPSEKKAGKRQPLKKKAETKNKPKEEQLKNTRRSGRLRQKKGGLSHTEDRHSDSGIDDSDKSHSDSDDDDDDDDTKSVRSEVSRKSSRSEISSRSSSVKKEPPKRSTRSSKKQSEPVVEGNDVRSKRDSERTKGVKGRARKNDLQENEPEVAGNEKQEKNCEENHLDMNDSDNEKKPELNLTRKRRLSYSTESDSKTKLEDFEENNLEKDEDIKTETKLENNMENGEEKEIKTEIKSENVAESEKEISKNGENSVKGEITCDESKNNEEPVSKDPENGTVSETESVDNHVKTSEDKDFSEAKSKVKSESEESQEKTECEPCITAEKKEETNVNAQENQEDTSSKEAAEAEEKEEEELEEERKPEPEEIPEPKTKPKPTPPPKSKTDSRWHLICTTLDDWINLSEWFKESSVRSEKALCKVIEEDFLPVLPEIIETREKEKLRRLRENELRKSARITQKQKEKLEQEKILAEAAAAEEEARKEAEEEKRLKEEHQRLEEENRLREERAKAREERAKRLSMREERARLVAEGKEIPPELIYTGLPAQRYKDDFDSDDSKPDILDDESFQSLMKVVDGMKNHKDCWPFLEPVTEEQAPGYHDVIKRPMDMSKIEQKVELREYRTQHHFLSDFRIMFNNCRRFNGPDSDFTGCAKSMEKVLKNLVKKYLLDQSTDPYYNDEDFVAGGAKGTQVEKKFRPKRQAGTKALQTVQKALKDDEESSSDEDSYVEPQKKPRRPEPISPSVNSLLLQEMIEYKRKRAEQQRAEGQLSPQKPSTTQGIMIMPREEIPTDGVLRLAASREIRWKIDPKNVTMKQGFATLPGNTSPVVKTPEAGSQQRMTRPPCPDTTGQPAAGQVTTPRPPSMVNVVHKKAAGLAPGQKIIKILASAPGSGIHAVKQTAESVKVSSDGYLILNGKPTSIKVTPNTKIVIQPQTAPSPNASSTEVADPAPGPSLGKELVIKKIPTPAGLQPLADVDPVVSMQHGGSTNTSERASIAPQKQEVPNQTPFNVNAQHPGVARVPNDRQPGIATGRVTIQTPGPVNTPVQQGTAHPSGPNSNQVMSPGQLETRKRQLDIAQRLLAAKRRQLMQNGPVTSKMARLETDKSSLESSPNFAVREQGNVANTNTESVNSLSSTVLQNVNISNDILASYYSVLNEAGINKTLANSSINSPQPVNTSQPVNTPQPVNTLHVNTLQHVNNIQQQPAESIVVDSVPQGRNITSTHAMTVPVPQHTPVNINRLLHNTPANTVTNIPVTLTELQESTNENQGVKKMSLSTLTTAIARSIAAGNLQIHRSAGNSDSQQPDNTNRPSHSVSDAIKINPYQLTSQNQTTIGNNDNSVMITMNSQGGITQQALQVSQPLHGTSRQFQYVSQSPQTVGQTLQHVTQPNQFVNQLLQQSSLPSSVSSAISEHIESAVIKSSMSNLLTTDSVGLKNQIVANRTNVQQVPTLATVPHPVTNLTDVQNHSQVCQSDIKPAVALFSGQTSPAAISPTKSLTSPNISQKLTSYSPPKTDRTGLFDIFESSKEKPVSDDFGFASLSEKTDASRTPTPAKQHGSCAISMKGTGKEYFGSPLNTSVMEALRSKLSPGKHPVVPKLANSGALLSRTLSQCIEDPLPYRDSIVASNKETCFGQDRDSSNTVITSVSLDLESQDTGSLDLETQDTAICSDIEAPDTKPLRAIVCDTNLCAGYKLNALETDNKENCCAESYHKEPSCTEIDLKDQSFIKTGHKENFLRTTPKEKSSVKADHVEHTSIETDQNDKNYLQTDHKENGFKGTDHKDKSSIESDIKEQGDVKIDNKEHIFIETAYKEEQSLIKTGHKEQSLVNSDDLDCCPKSFEKEELRSRFLDVSKPEFYMNKKKQPAVILTIREEDISSIQNGTLSSSERESEIEKDIIQTNRVITTGHKDEVSELKDLSTNLLSSSNIENPERKNSEFCRSCDNMSTVSDKIMSCNNLGVKRKLKYVNLEHDCKLEHPELVCQNKCEEVCERNEAEISDAHSEHEFCMSLLCWENPADLLSYKDKTNMLTNSCTSLKKQKYRDLGLTIACRDFRNPNENLNDDNDTEKTSEYTPSLKDQESENDAPEYSQAMLDNSVKDISEFAGLSLPWRSVKSCISPARTVDSTSLAFTEAPYSDYIKRQPHLGHKKTTIVIKTNFGQERINKRQVWHVKSPDNQGSGRKSGVEQVDPGVVIQVRETEVCIPSAKSDNSSTAQNIIISNTSLPHDKNLLRKRSVLSESVRAPELCQKKRKFIEDTCSYFNAENPSTATVRENHKRQDPVPLIDTQPPKLYKLRGVRSDSALGEISEAVNELTSDRLRLKLKRFHFPPYEETPSKHWKLNTVHSDSVLNLSSIDRSEDHMIDSEGKITEHDLRKVTSGDMKVKSIPYSQHLSEHASLKKRAKYFKSLSPTLKVSRCRSKSLSEPSEYKCRKALNFPESIVGFDGAQELETSSFLEDKHVSVICTSPLPSFLTQCFDGGGDLSNDNTNVLNNSSTNLILDEHLFMENLILPPDFTDEPDLNKIENDIFELQDQYLKSVDQTSPMGVFGTVDPRLGIQEMPQGNCLQRQVVSRSQQDSLKQTQKVSLTIAEDVSVNNWQHQNPQNQGSVQNKVLVQSLPLVLDRPDHFSGVDSNVTQESVLVSPSNPRIISNQMRTIENIFAGNDSSSNAAANLIATSDGNLNVTVGIENLNQAPVVRGASYLGSINVVSGLGGSQTIAVPNNLQENDSQQSAIENSQRLKELEVMFLKGTRTLQEPVVSQSPDMHVSGVGTVATNENRGDTSFTTTE